MRMASQQSTVDASLTRHEKPPSAEERSRLGGHSGEGALQTLAEVVRVSQRNDSESAWENYFNNSFDVCSKHAEVCGGAVASGGSCRCALA